MDTSYNNGCLDQVVIGVMDIHTRFKNLKAANGWHSKQPLVSDSVELTTYKFSEVSQNNQM